MLQPPSPQAPATCRTGNRRVLQRRPERGHCFHGPTLVTLGHCVAPRHGGSATGTLPPSFLQDAEEGVLGHAGARLGASPVLTPWQPQASCFPFYMLVPF